MPLEALENNHRWFQILWHVSVVRSVNLTSVNQVTSVHMNTAFRMFRTMLTLFIFLVLLCSLLSQRRQFTYLSIIILRLLQFEY